MHSDTPSTDRPARSTCMRHAETVSATRRAQHAHQTSRYWVENGQTYVSTGLYVQRWSSRIGVTPLNVQSRPRCELPISREHPPSRARACRSRWGCGAGRALRPPWSRAGHFDKLSDRGRGRNGRFRCRNLSPRCRASDDLRQRSIRRPTKKSPAPASIKRAGAGPPNVRQRPMWRWGESNPRPTL